MDDID